MRCHGCGHEGTDSAVYCDQCGSILSRDDPMNQLAHAYSLEVRGELERAVGEFERIIDAGLTETELALVRKHLGNLHFRLGHLRRAHLHLESACRSAPDAGTFWHDKGVVEYHLADFEQAVSSFRNALERSPDFLLAYFWLGNALYHQGDLDAAARAFRDLLERYPNFTIARFHLGVIHARQGNREASEKEFRRVLRKNPEDAAARFYVEH